MITLTVNGQEYQRWTSVRVSRGLKRAMSDFHFEAPCELTPPILPFAACTVMDDGELLLTGYVDDVDPDIGPRQSRTEIRGRSKTMDLECMPEFDTNQFNGNALDAIARTVCGVFGIGVVLGPGVDVGDPFPDATFERSENAFAFLERLARQRGILLTDDAKGNLVLATLGTAKAPGQLIQGPGGNVNRARGQLSGKQRFSQYTMRSQAGKKHTGAKVQTKIEAVAKDPGVPRYRPWAGIAESALLPGHAQLRADWEAAHRSGEAIKASITVPEWRAGGALWQINQLATCDVSRLGLNGDFLIGHVDYILDRDGKRTDLLVAPPSAYTSDPTKGETKGKGGKKGGAGGDPWAGIVKVT